MLATPSSTHSHYFGGHILKPIIMAVTSSLAKNFSRLLLLLLSIDRTKIKAWPMSICDLTTLLARPDNVHKLQPQKQHFQVIVLWKLTFLPQVPTTIKSTLCSSAYRIIAPATDVSVTITSVLITSSVLSLILLNHCSASFLAAPKICFTELGIVSSPNFPDD